jgi:hypothetical protein
MARKAALISPSLTRTLSSLTITSSSPPELYCLLADLCGLFWDWSSADAGALAFALFVVVRHIFRYSILIIINLECHPAL